MNEQPVPHCILTVYAHPDDESFGPSAALARYARAGSALYGIFATRGEHGQPPARLSPVPSPEELGRLREIDLREACRIIGYTEIEILHYEDGTLDQVPEAELAARVLQAIYHYHPDVLLTFGPAGITRHADHLAVHRAVLSAFRQIQEQQSGIRELYYDAVPAQIASEMGLEGEQDGTPNTWIDISETRQVRIDALRVHARHIQDAQEMIERLEQQPQTTQTFYRAWPEIPPGHSVQGFLQDDTLVAD